MTVTTGPALDSVEHAVATGEIFTRSWIVELILDLAGYTSDRDLATFRAVEPACGRGAFLGPMVKRLSTSLRSHDRSLSDAADALQAFDLSAANVDHSRRLVAETLTADGWDVDEAARLSEKLIVQADYLLRPTELRSTDFVLGNPPYIRLEDISAERTAAYRRACSAMGGRADVYVGFVELGLRSLKLNGTLGFIVADRWMHNAYGARLRQYVAATFSVDVTIQMHDVDAFEEQVSAYPAISVLRRKPQGRSIIADTTRQFGPTDARELYDWSRKRKPAAVRNARYEVDALPHWFAGDTLWPSGSPTTIALMEELTDRFQPLEDLATGTRVGIGVATGADQVYVTDDANAAEPERMMPLSMASDTNSGVLVWSKHYLVNPWHDNKVVELDDWPKMRRYLETNGEALRRRNVASRSGARWYRTIDRVTAGLEDVPKLLFPDMRMTSRPVYDPGGLYPHHNLYFIVSDVWNLKVLGGLLFSRVAEATIEAYCVKMRGGTLRFQAQYLRKIRVPRPHDISDSDAALLADAFDRRDGRAATEVALRVYGINGSVLIRRWV